MVCNGTCNILPCNGTCHDTWMQGVPAQGNQIRILWHPKGSGRNFWSSMLDWEPPMQTNMPPSENPQKGQPTSIHFLGFNPLSPSGKVSFISTTTERKVHRRALHSIEINGDLDPASISAGFPIMCTFIWKEDIYLTQQDLLQIGLTPRQVWISLQPKDAIQCIHT